MTYIIICDLPLCPRQSSPNKKRRPSDTYKREIRVFATKFRGPWTLPNQIKVVFISLLWYVQSSLLVVGLHAIDNENRLR